MSRMQAGEPITVKPTNNMYTVLAAVGLIVTILGLIVLYVRAGTLLQKGLFGQ